MFVSTLFHAKLTAHSRSVYKGGAVQLHRHAQKYSNQQVRHKCLLIAQNLPLGLLLFKAN